MTPRSIPLLLAALLTLCTSCASTWGTEGEGNTWLAHDVYFDLKDDSAESCDAFVEACWQELSDLDGIRFFASGTRVESLDGGVNDLGYDVSLHIFFVDKAAHDAYQTHPKHIGLIERFAGSWESVRVFDSFVQAQAIR